MISNGKVVVIDPPKFNSEDAALKHKFLSQESSALQTRSQQASTSQTTRKKLKSRAAASSRLGKLWLPSSKRLVLHGLLTRSELGSPHVINDPKGISTGLADFWRPIFSHKPINLRQAKAYATRFPSPWVWTLASKPSKESIQHPSRTFPNPPLVPMASPTLLGNRLAPMVLTPSGSSSSPNSSAKPHHPNSMIVSRSLSLKGSSSMIM